MQARWGLPDPSGADQLVVQEQAAGHEEALASPRRRAPSREAARRDEGTVGAGRGFSGRARRLDAAARRASSPRARSRARARTGSSSSLPPTTAWQATPARWQRVATSPTALPASVWASSRPSPVTTRVASASRGVEADRVQHVGGAGHERGAAVGPETARRPPAQPVIGWPRGRAAPLGELVEARLESRHHRLVGSLLRSEHRAARPRTACARRRRPRVRAPARRRPRRAPRSPRRRRRWSRCRRP